MPPTAITTKRFLDTNVIVYAYDDDEPDKQAVARRLLKESVRHDRTVISVQVLGEFYHVVTRRAQSPMTPGQAADAVERIKVLPIIDIDPQLVDRAVATCRRYDISYWDALIVAAAERAGCAEILSEDLNAGQRYHDVVAMNPFATTP